MMNNVNEISICEVCKNTELISVLNLGKQPLCDDLIPIGSETRCKEYPTEILFCKACSTAHQRFQVDKTYLFPKTYHYRARLTADVLSGMNDLVENCISSFGDVKNKKVLDIGCNDGSLLNIFKQKGAITFGIEPTAAANEATNSHKIINKFFDEQSSSDFVKMYGSPDYITFTNVFAHIENLDELLEALKKLIDQNTVLVIENHYLGSILHSNQFDTFYHEHPRSYSYSSFLKISEKLNLKILDLKFPNRYGGNIRVFLGNKSAEEKIDTTYSNQIIEKEIDFESNFLNMKENLLNWKKSKLKEISKLRDEYGYIVAKAFPGRASILLKLLELDETVIKEVYEKEGSKKIGNYVPGTRIPILPDSELFKSNYSDPILNLAWHIPEEIRSYLNDHKNKSKVVDIIEQKDFE